MKLCLVLFVTLAAMVRSAGVSADQIVFIPEEQIVELQEQWSAVEQKSSPARQKIVIRRVTNQAESLLKQYASSPNRFLVLEVLFRCRRQLVSLDNSEVNRKALLETAAQLAAAPNDFASARFEADLLQTQVLAAREVADPIARTDSLVPFVERYYGTDVEVKAIKTALFLADGVGSNRVVEDLCRVITERLPNNLELIQFQQDKLTGHVFGAAFAGALENTDGNMTRFPMDCMGVTTGVFFWTKENGGLDDLKVLASAWKNAVADPAVQATDHYRFVSINIDDLPDAGESILRELGLDWPALRMPGGTSNILFKVYGRSAPRIVTISPTGYVALSLPFKEAGRTYQSDLKDMFDKQWVESRYSSQLQSIFAGEFLVVDPCTDFDPARPPEWKAVAAADPADSPELVRTPESVPEEQLKAIQSCFVAPPARYRLTTDQARANYEKADALCQKIILAHVDAPDLWIVRNRRIMALMSLWKLTGQHKYYSDAVNESRISLEAGYPQGTDVIARFCLARQSLRNPEADPEAVISDFVRAGGPNVSGPVLAAASLLALDVGDRRLHETYRRALLDEFAQAPMMWTITAFCLDRYHRYWLYQPPMMGHWAVSYSSQHRYFLTTGEPEDAQRDLKLELVTIDGNILRIPEDTKGKWTVIEFQTADVAGSYIQSYASYVRKRPLHDLTLILAILGEDVELARERDSQFQKMLKSRGLTPDHFRTTLVPGGLDHSVVQKLGFLNEDKESNMLVLRPDGSIASALSGLSMDRFGSGMKNIIEWHDERAVDLALSNGDLEEAKRLAFTYAPVEPADQQTKRKEISIPHLRSRAKVYLAMGDLSAAADDAERAYLEVKSMSESINVRTEELAAAEALKAAIKHAMDDAD